MVEVNRQDENQLRSPWVFSLAAATKSMLRLLLPPIVLLPFRIVLSRRRARKAAEAGPFEGQGSLWVATVHAVQHYAEWGMGESTAYALESATCTVTSVETSSDWFARTVERHGIGGGRFTPIHVDLGPVGAWGRPLSYDTRSAISDYLEAPFGGAHQPDLLLVDGRFRVACLATALLRSLPGTVVILDDYPTRGYYRVVEELVRPVAKAGRQAVFVRPEVVDVPGLERLVSDFRHVMD